MSTEHVGRPWCDICRFPKTGMPPNDYYDERSLLSLRREAEEIDECIQLARAREEDLRGAPVEAVERKPKKMKPKKRKQNPGERVTCSVLRVVR